MELSSFIALANNKSSQNYKIINTVCCFGSRQYCRSEHKLNDSSDWLIRVFINDNHQIKQSIQKNFTYCQNRRYIKLLIRFQFLKYSFYHRNRHRQNIKNNNKLKTSTKLSIISKKKFNHLKSIKVKFKQPSRPTYEYE
jgi:hypothetical protein